ncbi:hypothetical protein DFP72DRAFT_827162, partial [Ephemerocybe angulata]
ALKFCLVLDITILGLPGCQKATAQITEADCPIELPINVVKAPHFLCPSPIALLLNTISSS